MAALTLVLILVPAGSRSSFAGAVSDAMPKFLMVAGVLMLVAVGLYARGLRVVDRASVAPARAPAGSSTSAAPGAPVSSTLTVTEHEWAVAPSTKAVRAGAVTFASTNTGTTAHELVVLRTDASPTTIAVDQGRASEEGDLGEAEDISPGATKSVTLQLPPGHYLLICNTPLGLRG